MESHVAPKDTAVKTESPTQVTTTKPLSTPPSQPIKSSQAVYKTFADRKWFDLSYIERLKERTKTLEDFVKQKRSGQLQKKNRS